MRAGGASFAELPEKSVGLIVLTNSDRWRNTCDSSGFCPCPIFCYLLHAQCSYEGRTIPLPVNQILRIFHNHDFVLFQHRQQDVLQFALPKLPFVKLCFHWLARRDARESAHPKEDVGILDGKKWTQYFHPDCCVRRNRFGAKYLKELGAPPGFGSIGAHFDDHLKRLCRYTCAASEKNQECTLR